MPSCADAACCSELVVNGAGGAREIAASAASPEEAAEVYAVSVMAVNPNGLAERLYLGDLARLLQLDQALAKTINDRVHAPA